MKQCSQCLNKAQYYIYATSAPSLFVQEHEIARLYACAEHLERIALDLRREHQGARPRVFIGALDEADPISG